MTLPIQAVERPVQPTLSIRTICAVEKLPEVLGPAYNEIGSYLDELREPPAGMPFVIYYNMDMQALDIEIGFPVSKALEGKDKIQSSAIPGGRAITCLYTGPYEQMVSAYEEINTWIEENGYQPSGVVYEFYLNSPMDVPPSELQTEIVFPLAA